GRSRHLARKLSLRRKRSSPNVFEMAATETITSIILIKLIRVSLGTVRHPRRFKIVVIDIQITLKQMLRDFIGIRVNRAKKSGMVNITSSVNSRERSGINTILHELNPLFTINVTTRDIKGKNVYSRVNSKATTQWRKTESANGVHLEGVASDNRSLFLLVLILLLMPTLNFLPVWFALSLLRFRLPSRLPMMFILWMVAMMVVIIPSRTV